MTVEVTQEDREAAASYYEATKSHRTDDHIVRLIRQGDHAHAMVSAFARHRIEATRAAAERIAELEGAAKALKEDMLMRAKMNAWENDGEIVVEAGAGVWSRFCTTLQHKEPKP